MGARILIIHATRNGSTLAVSEAVALVLKEAGFSVDLEPVKRKPSLAQHDAVVIGTAVRFGRPLPETLKFARARRHELRSLPVALFSLGTTMREDTAANRATALSHLVPLADIVGIPLTVGLFGGVVNFDHLSPLWRWLARLDKTGDLGEGDWRDWGAIRAWALDLADRLRQRLDVSLGNTD